MQISANFRPGKESPKAYLQRHDLEHNRDPFSWKAALLDNGGFHSLILDLFAFFSSRTLPMCQRFLEKTHFFFKYIITIHVFACIHLWPPSSGSSGSLCHLSGTPQQIERSSDLPSPPVTAKLTTGCVGWTWSWRPTQTWLRNPNANAHTTLLRIHHKHVLNRSKLHQQLQSKNSTTFLKPHSDTLHESWTQCGMAQVLTYSLFKKIKTSYKFTSVPTYISLDHVESSWGPKTICPFLNPYQVPLYRRDPEVQWACIHAQLHQQTARYLLPWKLPWGPMKWCGGRMAYHGRSLFVLIGFGSLTVASWNLSKSWDLFSNSFPDHFSPFEMVTYNK